MTINESHLSKAAAASGGASVKVSQKKGTYRPIWTGKTRVLQGPLDVHCTTRHEANVGSKLQHPEIEHMTELLNFRTLFSSS